MASIYSILFSALCAALQSKPGYPVGIFEKYGIKACSQALSMLRYKVKWSGLDPEKAEILKI
jgi:hypothetical protein